MRGGAVGEKVNVSYLLGDGENWIMVLTMVRMWCIMVVQVWQGIAILGE